MAFATQNVRRSVFGNLKVTAGAWTGSAGDFTGDIGVEGGQVYLAHFTKQQTTGGPTTSPFQFHTATSGAVTTVTVKYDEAITTGRFIIIHA